MATTPNWCYRTASRQIWGIDLQRHPQLTDPEWFKVQESGDRIPFPAEMFDVITARWVLEHVESPAAFLTEVARVLKPSGSFIALTPNGRHYVTWATRLLGILPHRLTQFIVERLYGRPRHDTFPTHYRLSTRRQFQRFAQFSGLELAAVHPFENPDYFRFWEPARRTAIVVDWLLDHVWRDLGRLYYVVIWVKPAITSAAA